MDTANRCTTLQECVPFQCGHGALAVDTVGATSGTYNMPRFNVATVRSPWIQHRSKLVLRKNSRFNVATVRSPWIQLGIRCKTRCCQRFNVATVRSPWIRTCELIILRTRLRFQCGHGALAVDTGHRLRVRGRYRRFNVATVRSPWIPSWVIAAKKAKISFNVATVRSPWIRKKSKKH